MRDLELLGLDGLLGLQSEKLVRRLHGLQSTRGRLALAHEVGQRAFVLRQVLRHLRLHPHRGVQAVERVLPAFACVLCHAVAADGGGVLLRVQARERGIHALHVVGQPLRFGNQAFRGGERRAQPVDDVEVQLRQVARLVHQHLRFVLKLVDLIVDLLQRANGGQRVLHEIGRVEHRQRRCGLHGQQRHRQRGGERNGKHTGLHGETSSG